MRALLATCLLALLPASIPAQGPWEITGPIRNDPERVEWFRGLGLGLFIHWSVDSQLGSVISHSLVGASRDYAERYFEELPRSFHPTRFDADEWARLARVAGFRYAVLTAKHHSGFCLFDTDTSDFDIASTPYAKDVVAEFVRAFRAQGLAVGFYFSPDDFHVLHRQGTLISRIRPEALPQNNPELMDVDLRQVRELLTRYGPIDLLFIDASPSAPGSEPKRIRELAWELQPQIVVTRGAMKTPEIAPSTDHVLPGRIDPDPWEACVTLGTQWQYKPTNETYMTGGELIGRFVEIRAKGGNLLLNVGPHPDGHIPAEQQAPLRELGLWNFVNREAVFDVEPWVVAREGDVWFTRQRGGDAVYAVLTNQPGWKLGTWRSFTLRSVRLDPDGAVEVLGQNDRVLEYQQVVPKTTWSQDERGLHVRAMRAQRLYNDRTWPNPVVLKLSGARPALSSEPGASPEPSR